MRMMMIAALLSIAAPLVAADPAATVEALQGRLSSGDNVRVVDLSGAIATGRFAQLSTDAITLQNAGAERQLRLSDVAEVAVRHRSPGRGALLGLAAGAVVGAMSSECRSPHRTGFGGYHASCSEAVEFYAAAGAGAGAIIGIFVPHHSTVFRNVQFSPAVGPAKTAGLRIRW